jgi:two-component system, NarL family, sensor histidine kinase UhpB
MHKGRHGGMVKNFIVKAQGWAYWHVLVPALVCLALLGSLFWLKWAVVERAAKLPPQIEAYSETEESIHVLQSAHLSMQAARRGFALTGDGRFASDFEEAAQRTRRGLDALERHMRSSAPDGALAAGLRELRDASTAYERLLRDAVAARNERPQDMQTQEQATIAGEAFSHAIHAQLNALEQDKELDFRHGMQSLVESTNRSLHLELLLFGVSMAATVAGFTLAGVELRRCEAARRALQEANAGLAAEVTWQTASLAASEQRWRSLVELSADAIVLSDAQDNIEYMNPVAWQMLSRADRSGASATSISGLFGGEAGARLRQSLGRLRNKPGRLRYVATTLARTEGPPLAVQVGAVSYEEAGAIRVQIVIHDLSELRRQESATQDQLRFIEQLIEAIPLPLSLRDPDGRFLRVNRAFELAHRSDRHELLGLSLFDLLPHRTAEAMARQDAAARHSRRPLDYGVRFDDTTADGAVQDMLVRVLAMRRDDASLVGTVTIETDVTAMRRKEDELRTLNAELSGMSARLIGAQENERRRIARELHDQVGQVLTALKIQICLLAQAGRVDAATLAPLRELADEALRHARDLTASLHPHLLDDLGLEPALNWLLDRFVRPTGLAVTLECSLKPERGSPAIELVAFRVIQESLTNVVRHAHACSARVLLRGSDSELLIEVRDDGEGFTATDTWFDRQVTTSVGVAGMRERVADLGGEFDIDTAPGSGTSVRVLLPW